MTDIYLVRHAQPTTVKRKLIPTLVSKSSALSEIGRAQARVTGQRLREIAATKLFSSPIPRALETAQIIGSLLDMEIQVRDELKEQNRGPLISVVPTHYIPKMFPADWKKWQSGDLDYSPPQGESTGNFLLRVDEILKEMETISGTVIAITHFGFVQGVICKVLDMPFRFSMPFDFSEASITHIRSEDGERVLFSLNETSHWQIALGISNRNHRVVSR